MTRTAAEWRSRYEREAGRRDNAEEELNHAKKSIKRLKRRTEHINQARALIIEVARQTQRQLEYHVGEVVSLALSAVFESPYEFELEFEEKRGKTEARLWLTDGTGERLEPIYSTGGGVVDTCAFALRVALWSLQRPRSRNVLVLDEPFRFLNRSRHSSASEMLREVSEKLGLQIIMVSHSEELIEGADRVFRVGKGKGGKSTVSRNTQGKV